MIRGLWSGWRRQRAAEAAYSGEKVEIPAPDRPVPGILYPVLGSEYGVIMVGGSRGGVRGPAGIYAPLANQLRDAGVVALRLHYRRPNHLADCDADVLAALGFLAAQGVSRVVLIGWSFGGAVVVQVGAASGQVVGVATVASQTAGTGAVADLAPKPLLLLHGSADQTLSPACSRDLYARARRPKELLIYPGDDHGLTRHADAALEKLCAFCRETLSA